MTAGKPPHELAADYDLEITDHNIENFNASLLPEAGIVDEIRVLEDDAKVPDGVVVNFVPTSGWMTRVGARGTLVARRMPVRGISIQSGRFHEKSTRPGEYGPQVMRIPEGYAVTEIRFERSSARNNAMNLSGPNTPVAIVLTSRPSAVGGIVRNEDQTPVRGGMVALLPDPLLG